MGTPANQLSTATQTVYRWIIDDVIAKMKPEVVQEGLDESLLDDLRSIWEAKLVEKGLLDSEPAAAEAGPSAAPAVAPTTAGFAGLGAFSFQAQLAAATANNPSAAAAILANHPAVLQAVAGIKRAAPDGGFDAMQKLMQDIKAPVVPQRDGAADEDSTVAQPSLNRSTRMQLTSQDQHHQGSTSAAAARQLPSSPCAEAATKLQAAGSQLPTAVPQRDGPADEGEEGGEEGGGAEEAAAEPASDEVLSEDDEDEEEEEEDQPNFLCCQFEKVGRTKNKWKVSLKEGVFHINGKDYLFKKGQGEWIF